MRHIYHEEGVHLLRDLADALEVDDAGISGSTCYDHLRLYFLRLLLESIIVDQSFCINTIRNKVVQLTGHIDRCAVGQMTAIRQAHTHYGVAGL